MPVNSLPNLLLRSVVWTIGRGEFVAIHPDWRDRTAAIGLSSADDFLNHPGEIISGHPDRHVMRATFGTTKVYLKREHRIPWKDRLSSFSAGFGPASVSGREAGTLQMLADAGLPGPEWIAFGEDGRGRAFLVLKSVEGSVDLRRHLLALCRQPLRHRRNLARRLGRSIASVHNAGFEYPDLYGKHILVNPSTIELTLLDWQRSRMPHRLSWRTRCRDLASLNASLADELAMTTDRTAFLIAYLRESVDPAPSFGTICRTIETRSAKLLKRSSIREQRLPTFRESQPLVWLDGEAIAVTPMGRDLFSDAELLRLAYPPDFEPIEFCEADVMVSSDGTRVERMRRRSVRRFRKCGDMMRGRRWTSPESRRGADLLRRERLGEPARLLAFGQRERSWGVIESFLLRRINDERPAE